MNYAATLTGPKYYFTSPAWSLTALCVNFVRDGSDMSMPINFESDDDCHHHF